MSYVDCVICMSCLSCVSCVSCVNYMSCIDTVAAILSECCDTMDENWKSGCYYYGPVIAHGGNELLSYTHMLNLIVEVEEDLYPPTWVG